MHPVMLLPDALIENIDTLKDHSLVMSNLLISGARWTLTGLSIGWICPRGLIKCVGWIWWRPDLMCKGQVQPVPNLVTLEWPTLCRVWKLGSGKGVMNVLIATIPPLPNFPTCGAPCQPWLNGTDFSDGLGVEHPCHS